MKDFALDIETLGVRPGYVVLSVGICLFDRYSRERQSEGYTAVLDLEESRKHFSIDLDTQNWWHRQSEAARDAAFGRGFHKPIPPFKALKGLLNWVEKHDPEQNNTVWAVGQDFDFPILQACFDHYRLRWPFKYNACRDVRTLCDAAHEVTGFDRKDVEFFGTQHEALDDARHAARLVQEAFHALFECKGR